MTAARAAAPSTFVHRYVPASAPGRPPILLLHGTGGNEDDLLGLGERVAPGSALISPRGKVREGGANRFFRRFAEGVFDEEDLAARTHELADFVDAIRAQEDVPAPVAIGFSNGANIAAAMLLLRPGTLAGAVLLRAMSPFAENSRFADPVAAIPGTPVLLLSGDADPIVPAADAARLAATLKGAGAEVTRQVLPAGHGLSSPDLGLTHRFVAGLSVPA
ncbi:alpha/beta hydrolase [Ancylobacter oerskovii]|uniref:Alpha/beta hydrolase n=1 Tax=Ancylobacter oerskovii TaxID=459519 RepID=A0ABW4YW74_9HYPH|nr:alpha/beta hydrolase [Ancylobacter oerskovii]MBS7542385.1 alpha/beta hydrolase [Ancylobacter oerskovii]